MYPAENAAASPLRYEIDGAEQYRIQMAIDEADLDLGAIYHSHTRSAPVAVADRHQPRLLSRRPVRDRRPGRRRRRRARVHDPTTARSRRPSWSWSDERAGARVPELLRRPIRPRSASARACACRSCTAVRTPRPSWVRSAIVTLRARKIKPQLAEGELVRVAGARNQAEAEFIQGLLLEEGVPSMLRRSAGFDVPDFLAAGPRDVLVPAVRGRDRPRGPARGRACRARADARTRGGARPPAGRNARGIGDRRTAGLADDDRTALGAAPGGQAAPLRS